MSIGINCALAAILVLASSSVALADDNDGKAKHQHRHAFVAAPVPPPVNFAGGRLVMNPAFNIACQTRDRATRALPCDQPVWVYGSPCEIDLGQGRWRNCDEPPGVVHGGLRGGAFR